MFLNPKRIYLVLLFSISGLVLGCGGGQNTIDQAVTGESDQIPNLGQAISGPSNETTANTAPEITSVSLGCDLAVESLSIEVGETITFSMEVSDESPNTLDYAVYANDPSLLNISVDTNGNVSLEGLSDGKTIVPITVTDEAGLKNEVYLSVDVGA